MVFFRSLSKAFAGNAQALPASAKQYALVASCGGRRDGWSGGLVVPQVLGVGYSYVGDALNGNMALKLMVLLVVLKFFAITTSYA